MAEGGTFDSHMEALRRIAALRGQMEDLKAVKERVMNLTEFVDLEEFLLDQYRQERKSLLLEKEVHLSIIRTIMTDVQMLDGLITKAEDKKKEANQKLQKVIVEDYEPLKDEINQKRESLQLPLLPSIQKEVDQEMSSYLEKRRKEWIDSVPGGDGSNRAKDGKPAKKRRKKKHCS